MLSDLRKEIIRTIRFGMGKSSIPLGELYRQYCSARLIMITFAASLNSFSMGYDLGWWSILIAVPHFGYTFGQKDILLQGVIPWRTFTSTQLALGAVVPSIGAVIAVPWAAYLAKKYGRKSVFYTCYALTIIATVMEMTCGPRFWQIVGGKVVVGLGIGFGQVVIPLYLSEIAPAPIRGAMLNTISVNTWLGNFVSVAVGYAVRLQFNKIVWLLPIGLQFVMPVVLVIMTMFIPESPRWYLEQGRREEALTALRILKIPSLTWSPEDQLVLIEAEILQAETRPMASWRDCFKGTNLIRTWISVGVQGLNAGLGMGFVANYTVLIVQAFTDKYLEVFLGVLGAMVAAVATGFVTQDLFGRRTLLLFGSAFSCILMLVYAIVSTVFEGELKGSAGIGGLLAICLWILNYTQTWSSVPNTVFSEIPTLALRSKVVALAVGTNQLVNIIIVLTSPYVQNSQGGTFQGKIGYIYAAVGFCSFLFVWFYVPDLSGCTLEQVDDMFEKRVPIGKMHEYHMERSNGIGEETSSVIVEDQDKPVGIHIEKV